MLMPSYQNDLTQTHCIFFTTSLRLGKRLKDFNMAAEQRKLLGGYPYSLSGI